MSQYTMTYTHITKNNETHVYAILCWRCSSIVLFMWVIVLRVCVCVCSWLCSCFRVSLCLSLCVCMCVIVCVIVSVCKHTTGDTLEQRLNELNKSHPIRCFSLTICTFVPMRLLASCIHQFKALAYS